MSKLAQDPRVDPRIKAVFATFELPPPNSVANRQEMLAEEATEPATARAAGMKAFLDAMDTQGCSMHSTEAPVGQGLESSESGGVSGLTEGAGSVTAQHIVGEAA